MPAEAVLSTKIRLATASPATQSTRGETMAQLERLARSAGEEKADFLLLPEAYLGGYPRGSDFGCKVGGRTEEGRDEFRRYFREAIDLGDVVGPAGAGGLGKWVKREPGGGGGGDEEAGSAVAGAKGKGKGDGTREELERVARETGVFIVVGLVERTGGSLYCAVVYVCPRRGMIGKRRKVMPTGTERLIWAQGSPATLKAVSTTIRGIRVNLAAAICWENYMPLLRQSLYAQNINLYFAPTADGRDTWLPLMRTIAIEGRCFVVSSNMCVRGGGGGGGAAAAAAGKPSHARRGSHKTREGFEIATPAPGHGQGHGPAPKARRNSVFDEDGNEIVLGSPVASLPASEIETTTATGPFSSSSAVIEEEEEGEEKEEKEGPAAAFISRGGSSVVSPFGDVLAGPQWEDDEGVVYADVDLEDCVRGRLDLDAAGSYSRNDSFKLSVQGLDLSPLPYYS
ncbi:putative nitrilase [Rosellinia necatrix]|uniref:Putative nitrilase n=1 Tax=Rosellinia necatrix TaxID=77044 RepID=A0A1W2TCG9_ROSNE|nr:putative nitrilase [Rosellinia necatrix]